MQQNNIFGQNWTERFKNIFEDEDDFYEEWNAIAVFRGSFGSTEETDVKRIYLLLCASYGNSTIANFDITQFKLKLWSLIFQYGPTWAKKLEYQSGIRALTVDELRNGSTAIFNHSFNPSTSPSTATLDELTTIDNQNTTKNKKGLLDTYFQASQYLEQDFTKSFLDKFKILFNKIVEPQEELFYVTEEDDEDE